MNKIKGTDIIWADILMVVFDDKCVKLYCGDPRLDHPACYTFDDIIKVAKDNGYVSGSILLIAESPLTGHIYQYGNYEPDQWYEHGKTMGYA